MSGRNGRARTELGAIVADVADTLAELVAFEPKWGRSSPADVADRSPAAVKMTVVSLPMPVLT